MRTGIPEIDNLNNEGDGKEVPKGWVLVDAIRFGQRRTIFAPNDGEPVLRFGIAKTTAVSPPDPNAQYKVLVKFFEDGTVAAVQIDLTEPCEFQQELDPEDNGGFR